MFRCFLSKTESTAGEIAPPLLNKPVPLGPESVPGGSFDPRQAAPTYGDYFLAVQTFLQEDRFHRVLPVLARHLEQPVHPSDITGIDISLEKHGRFYHPARVDIHLGPVRAAFVVNVALSAPGNDLMEREFRCLRKLGQRYPWPFLPAVYVFDRIRLPGADRHFSLFLGRWIEGYHEFHVSRTSPAGLSEMTLWDPEIGPEPIPQISLPELLRRAAMMLTCYFDLETYAHIFPWSHAAGDFIARCRDGQPDLRLISVRNYAPCIKARGSDPVSMLHAALVFLVQLSIQMRLDRIDGVGPITWLDDRAVFAAVDGFFDGMAQKTTVDPVAEPFGVLFRNHLRSVTQADLVDIFHAIVGAHYPSDPAATFIRGKCAPHARSLHAAIGSCSHLFY